MTDYSHEENVDAVVAEFKMKMQKIIEKIAEEQFQSICGAEVIYEEESNEDEKDIHIECLGQVPPKMEDNKLQVQDPMKEINLGNM